MNKLIKLIWRIDKGTYELNERLDAWFYLNELESELKRKVICNV